MRLSTLWLVQLVTLVYASFQNWTKPSSLSPSFTDTFIIGEHVFISWNTLNNSVNDLWLTRYDTKTDAFALRLQVARDVSLDSGNYEWIIAVNETEVFEDTRFILQFLPTGSAYDPKQPPQIPSPPFNLRTLNQLSALNGTVGAPSTVAISTAATSTQTDTPTSSTASVQTDLPPPGDDGPLLSGNVAIGVAIGAAVLALGTIVGAFLVVRAYKRPKPTEEPGEEKITGPYEVLGTSRQPTELSSKETMMHELNSPTDTVYEMSTTTKRPGLHELPG